MVNFGYPYNDLVICKDSTDYLVRSFVDDASTVWDHHQKFNQEKLEMVQRRAARFVKSRYRRTDSVTAMLNEPGQRTGLAYFIKKAQGRQTHSFLQNY